MSLDTTTDLDTTKIKTGIFSLKKEATDNNNAAISENSAASKKPVVEDESSKTITTNGGGGGGKPQGTILQKWKDLQGTKEDATAAAATTSNGGTASPSSSQKKLSRRKSSDPEQTLKGVIFALSGFQNPQRSEIRDQGIKLGAKYRPDWTSDCTHLVSAFANTTKANQVKIDGGKIVKKEWIEDCEKKQTLLDWSKYQFNVAKKQHDSDSSDVESSTTVSKKPVLNGVIFALSGFQNPLRSQIRDQGIKLGAKYRPDWTDDCTHLVAAYANTAKACQVRKVGGKIVTKEWLEESASKNTLANWTEYQLKSDDDDSDSDSDDVDSTKPRKAARNAKTKISKLRQKDEFDDSFESEEDVENSDDRDFIADSDEIDKDDHRISASSSSSSSSSTSSSDQDSKGKRKKKNKKKTKKVKKAKKALPKAKKLSKKTKPTKKSSSSSSDSSSSSSESDVDLEAYKKKKEQELLALNKKKTPADNGETLKKKGIKYEDDDEDGDDQKKSQRKTSPLKKTQSTSSTKTEVNSDSNEELVAPKETNVKVDKKQEDGDDEWQLPTFFENKNFYIYGDYNAKKIKELTRVIVGFGGDLKQYISDDVNYVITDKKWSKEFEESKQEYKNIIIVNENWLDACSRRRKFVAYSTFEITPNNTD